jgi:lambda family phage portal protein
MEVLPAGWDVKQVDPAYPNQSTGDFVKTMLRAFAAGVGLSYNSLASDYESVNYSSLRAAAANDQDAYTAIQQFAIEAQAAPMVSAWLEEALAWGAVGTLPRQGFERFNKAVFQPRGWADVDPLKDAKANAENLAQGVTTVTDILRAQGGDLEALLQTQVREQKLYAKYGIKPPTNPAASAAAPAAQAEDASEDGDELFTAPKKETP